MHVQRSSDSGSPRVTGSTSRSRSSRKLGSLVTVFLRPPPLRRIRPSFPPPPSCSSLIPWLIALRESPVARETVEIPPHPITIASLAATSRRARSFSSPLTRSNLRLIASSSLMPHSPNLPKSCLTYTYRILWTPSLPTRGNALAHPTMSLQSSQPGRFCKQVQG